MRAWAAVEASRSPSASAAESHEPTGRQRCLLCGWRGPQCMALLHSSSFHSLPSTAWTRMPLPMPGRRGVCVTCPSPPGSIQPRAHGRRPSSCREPCANLPLEDLRQHEVGCVPSGATRRKPARSWMRCSPAKATSSKRPVPCSSKEARAWPASCSKPGTGAFALYCSNPGQAPPNLGFRRVSGVLPTTLSTVFVHSFRCRCPCRAGQASA